MAQFNIIRKSGADYTLYSFDNLFRGKSKNDAYDLSNINGELRVYTCGLNSSYEVFKTTAAAKEYIEQELTEYLADLFNLPQSAIVLNYIDKKARRKN